MNNMGGSLDAEVSEGGSSTCSSFLFFFFFVDDIDAIFSFRLECWSASTLMLCARHAAQDQDSSFGRSY